MARQSRNAIITSVGVGILALSAALASANISADPRDEELATAGLIDDFDAQVPPSPVGGVPLFVMMNSEADKSCMTGEEVVSRLQADQEEIGGETIMLANGLEQAFADSWRRVVDVNPVPVSNVIAHIFGDASGSEVVDVVEFDAQGCAMSRTILSAEDWDAILTTASGYEV